MTLAELYDAIIGHRDEEADRLQWQLWGVRKIIVYQLASQGAKDIKEEDIFSLDIDDKIRAERIKNMEPIKVTDNGTGQ